MGSSRNHSSPTNDVRGVGIRDEPLRMFAWEANNHIVLVKQSTLSQQMQL